MFFRRFAASVALAIAVVFAVGDSYSNGINPPQPRGAVVVKAVCKDRSGGSHELFRTRIMNGDNPVEGITFVIQGVREQVDIRDIKTLRLSAGEVDSNGFVKGYLTRNDQTDETETKVLVRANNGGLRLEGFSETGDRLSIDFVRCESIDFTSGTSRSISHKPIMKN